MIIGRKFVAAENGLHWSARREATYVNWSKIFCIGKWLRYITKIVTQNMHITLIVK